MGKVKGGAVVHGQRPPNAGTVRGFPRLRLGGWDLLFRALRATVGDRNP